jgi:hypothetical protein
MNGVKSFSGNLRVASGCSGILVRESPGAEHGEREHMTFSRQIFRGNGYFLTKAVRFEAVD